MQSLRPFFLLAALLAGVVIGEFAPSLADAAQEDISDCKSIADTLCYERGPIIIANGMAVAVQSLSNQTFEYPLSNEKDEETRTEYAFYCPEQKCICETNVQYIEFKETSGAIKEINQTEKAEAQKYKCDIDTAFVKREPQYVYTSPTLISTGIRAVKYCRTCGGSCHGQTNLTTYDAASGKIYTVKDIMPPENMAKLKEAMIAEFLEHFLKPELKSYGVKNDEIAQELTTKEQMLKKELAKRSLVEEGIYVENGKVYIDLDSVAIDCASGSFFPLEIPKSLIAPVFLKLLESPSPSH